MGVAITQVDGVFRVRRHESGDVEVWAKGWRLEVRFLSLVPALLAVGFALSSIFLPVRLLGCVGLLGSALVLHRLTEVGIRMGAEGLTFHDLLRSRQIAWDDAVSFMGERTRHDGKLALLLRDGSTLTAPGSLTGEEMNPIGDEGDLSAVEELNRMTERFRRGLPVTGPRPLEQITPEPRSPRVRAKGPTTRPRSPEPVAQHVPLVESPAGMQPAGVEPPPLRHPHVPRPPKPEPDPEPNLTRRAARRARRRRGANPQLIQVPDAEGVSPGARLLSSFDEPDNRR